MIRTILSHDLEAGTAHIRFEHEGITIEDTYNLIHLVPGTEYVMASMGLSFDEFYQNKAIDYLEARLLDQIESGAILPPPPSADPEYVAPTEPEEPSAPEGE
ncbi:hypothetical protein [Sphingobium sp. LSP13-1-1.1]|uniref:hypothetical protein n=1 Tax=Sphingobium sp. LSP13-1-1.1 TaxID=3135234 RepID=UPI00342343DF